MSETHHPTSAPPRPRSTDWDGLRPQNVVQAARVDIARRARNTERATDHNSPIYGDDYEPYAFMRRHVVAADGAFGLIELALKAVTADMANPNRPLLAAMLKSTKRYMRHLYERKLLEAALAMEKKRG